MGSRCLERYAYTGDLFNDEVELIISKRPPVLNLSTANAPSDTTHTPMHGWAQCNVARQLAPENVEAALEQKAKRRGKCWRNRRVKPRGELEGNAGLLVKVIELGEPVITTQLLTCGPSHKGKGRSPNQQPFVTYVVQRTVLNE